MTLVRHELRLGRTAFAVWTASLAFLLAVCVGLFPEMKSQMRAASGLFASMGRFTAAFGMDRLNFGTLIGFYAVECGSILGLGGAFFASLLGVSALAKEERGHTAEFLLTHPLSRARVVTAKLAAVLAQITAMDMILLGLALAAIWRIGEEFPWKELLLLHGAYYLLHLEMAAICFGISAFLRRGGAGVGMGLAAVMYSLDLVSNMTDRAGSLKYITPFGYCDGADIIAAGRLDPSLLLPGMLFSAAALVAAYRRYETKDIR